MMNHPNTESDRDVRVVLTHQELVGTCRLRPPPLLLPECVPSFIWCVCVRVCVYTWGCMGRWVGGWAGGCVWCSCQTPQGGRPPHARHTWDKKSEVSKPGQEDSRPAGRRGRIPTHPYAMQPAEGTSPFRFRATISSLQPAMDSPWLLARDIPAPCSISPSRARSWVGCVTCPASP